jgi:DNA-binding NarL/FixJ family response regulator
MIILVRVIIVEDDIELVEGFVQLLKLKKIDVLGVGHNGKQAVELCIKHSPDFLIMDISMSEFDGFYALEKLQGNPTKIIVMTGVIDNDILQKLHHYTIFSIQIKPIKYDALFKLLNIG